MDHDLLLQDDQEEEVEFSCFSEHLRESETDDEYKEILFPATSERNVFREDEQFCEVRDVSERVEDILGVNGDCTRRQGPGVFYAPDRPPPLVDFLMVLTAFLVAVFAAYYSISQFEEN